MGLRPYDPDLGRTKNNDKTSNESPSSASNPNPPNDSPANPTSLPPAALALASQIFDLARTGSTTLLEQYLNAGIPPNLTNSSGNTLLMLAAYHDHPETVSMLLDRGADVDAANERGQTPLAGAVFKGYEEVVKVLVEKGRARGEQGTPSAIETAKMFRREGCLRLLGVPEGEWADLPEGMVMPGPPPPSSMT